MITFNTCILNLTAHWICIFGVLQLAEENNIITHHKCIFSHSWVENTGISYNHYYQNKPISKVGWCFTTFPGCDWIIKAVRLHCAENRSKPLSQASTQWQCCCTVSFWVSSNFQRTRLVTFLTVGNLIPLHHHRLSSPQHSQYSPCRPKEPDDCRNGSGFSVLPCRCSMKTNRPSLHESLLRYKDINWTLKNK